MEILKVYLVYFNAHTTVFTKKKKKYFIYLHYNFKREVT